MWFIVFKNIIWKQLFFSFFASYPLTLLWKEQSKISANSTKLGESRISQQDGLCVCTAVPSAFSFCLTSGSKGWWPGNFEFLLKPLHFKINEISPVHPHTPKSFGIWIPDSVSPSYPHNQIWHWTFGCCVPKAGSLWLFVPELPQLASGFCDTHKLVNKTCLPCGLEVTQIDSLCHLNPKINLLLQFRSFHPKSAKLLSN